MNLTPRGCSGIGGGLASCMEDCRNRALRLFASYGYNPFNPAEFQLLEGTMKNLSRRRRRRLVTVNSPFGEPCCLRADITLSAISYLASHYAPEEFPLRLSYAERVFSVPIPPKENLEETQVGVELLGWEAGGADVEVVSLLLRALDGLGLRESVVVLGDASIVPQLFSRFAGMSGGLAELLVEQLQECAYFDYRRTVDSSADLREEDRSFLRELPSLKGTPDVLDRAEALFSEFGSLAAPGAAKLLAPLTELSSSLERMGYGGRIRIDLGFIRDLGYYSGPVFNVYASPDGNVLGGGGRYDWILSEMGLSCQAVGFGLNLRELALACKPAKGGIDALIWAGSIPADRAIMYAASLSERGASVELSWKLEEQSSRRLATRRGSRWWVNLEGGYAEELATGVRKKTEEIGGATEC